MEAASSEDRSQLLATIADLRRDEERLRRLNDALVGLARDPDFTGGELAAALDRLTAVAARALAVDRVGVWRLDPRRRGLICESLYDAATGRHVQGASLDASACASCMSEVEESRAHTVADAAQVLVPACPDARGVGAYIRAAIRLRGEVFGVVRCEQIHGPRRWFPEEEAFIASVADHAALAVQAEERRRAEAHKDVASRIAQEAVAAPSLEVLYRSVHAIVDSVVPMQSFYFAMVDEAAGMLEFPYCHDPVAGPCKPRKLTSGVTEYVLRTGRTLCCDAETLVSLRAQGVVPHGPQPAVWFGVPLQVDGRTIGVMVAQDYGDANALAAEEMEFLEYVSSQVARAIAHRRTVVELRESETRYRLVTRATNDTVWDWDVVHDRIRYAGPMTLGGYTAAEVEADRSFWYAHLHPEDHDRTVASLQAAFEKSDHHWSGEYRYLCRDSTWAHVHDRGAILYDETGRAVRMIGCMSDVTVKRRLEEELRARNRDLRALHLISEITLAGGSLDEVLQRAVAEVATASGFQQAAIELYDAERDVMVFAATHGLQLPDGKPLEVPVDETLFGIVARTGEPIVEPRVWERPEYRHAVLRQQGTRTFVCVPMRSGGRVLGALTLADAESVPCAPDLVGWLRSAANHLALVIERVRADREMQARRDFLQQITDALGQGLVVTDADWRLEYVNQATARLAGEEAEALLGRSVFEFVHPEDRERMQQEHARRRAGASSSYAVRFVTRSGAEAYVMVTAAPRWRDGRLAGVIALITDLTEHRRAEEALARSQERLALALWGADLATWDYDVASGRITRERCIATLRGTPAHASQGHVREWVQGIHPQDRERVERALGDHIEGRTPQYDIEYRLRDAGGGWRSVLARGRVVERDAAGRALRAAGTLRDVTELRQAEIQVRRLRAERRLREREHRLALVRAQDIERASLSRELHDGIGQVLTSLQMSLASKNKSRSDLEEDIANAQLASRLVSQLSRLLHPPELEVGTLFDVVQDRLGEPGSAERPRVTVARTGDEPRLGTGAKTHLFRIVQESVSNALRHAGARRIDVRFLWRPRRLVLEIEDDGCGLAAPVRAGAGMRSIRDRALLLGGRARWIHLAGGGTGVRVVVPAARLRGGAP